MAAGAKSSPVVRLSRSRKFCATFAPAPVSGVATVSRSEVLREPVVLVEEGDRWIEGDVVVVAEAEALGRCARVGAIA